MRTFLKVMAMLMGIGLLGFGGLCSMIAMSDRHMFELIYFSAPMVFFGGIFVWLALRKNPPTEPPPLPTGAFQQAAPSAPPPPPPGDRAP